MAQRPFVHLLILLLSIVLSSAVRADPPGRVGRIADVQGGVSFYDAETGDWVAAVRNRPLTGGDRVSTEAAGRAELRVGSATFRLGAGTEVELLQLDDERVRLQVHNGQVALRLRSNESAREFELVTDEARIQPERAGRYRLDRVDATSRVTVWSGQLAFEAPGTALTLLTGQRADLWANGGRIEYTLIAPQRDPFADEVAALELADERSVSTRYVSPEMTGVEELDRHGRWDNDAEYGALWVPRAVAPGWAPYRFGHWAWVRPWGWTWVDDAPWGFAPFHYGRWVFVRNNWCWSPGTWVARPVYAPALVAWVGSPGVSVSIGSGPTVGWFPLGPREVFVPGYRTSPRYVRNVNVTQVTNITNVTNIINSPNTVVQQTNYINRGVPGAVTVVPSTVLSGRQPVAPSRVQLTDPRPRTGGPTMQTMAAPTVVPRPAATAPVTRPATGVAVGRPAPVATANVVAPGPAPATPQPSGVGTAGSNGRPTSVPPSAIGDRTGRPAGDVNDVQRNVHARPLPMPSPVTPAPQPNGLPSNGIAVAPTPTPAPPMPATTRPAVPSIGVPPATTVGPSPGTVAVAPAPAPRPMPAPTRPTPPLPGGASPGVVSPSMPATPRVQPAAPVAVPVPSPPAAAPPQPHGAAVAPPPAAVPKAPAPPKAQAPTTRDAKEPGREAGKAEK